MNKFSAFLSAFLLVALLGVGGTVFAQSNWDATLKASTEAFTIIDDADSLSDIYLQFGENVAETLTFNLANDRFEFSNDIYINGNIAATGSLFISNDGVSNDATIIFDELTSTNLSYNFGNNRFEFSNDVYINGGLEAAGSITGTTLATTTLPNCETLETNSGGQLTCGAGTVIAQTGSSLATIQVRRSSGSVFTLTNQDQWYQFPFTIIDSESNTDVIEHNTTTASRIDIKEDGYYFLSYRVDHNANVNHELWARVTQNGMEIPGSYTQGRNFGGEFSPNVISVVSYLENGDYVELEVQRKTVLNIQNDTILTVTKLEGVRGPEGPAGTGGLTQAETDALYVNTAGDTMTGALINTVSVTSEFINVASATPPTCNVANFGRQWVDSDTGMLYVCDPSRTKWLTPADQSIWGEQNGAQCVAGDSIGSEGDCVIEYGSSVGVNQDTEDNAIYFPHPITITGYGFSNDDNDCNTGTFSIETWTSGGTATDEPLIFEADIATGIGNVDTSQSSNLSIDLRGQQYRTFGIDNDCGQTIDDYNMIIYYRYRHD